MHGDFGQLLLSSKPFTEPSESNGKAAAYYMKPEINHDGHPPRSPELNFQEI